MALSEEEEFELLSLERERAMQGQAVPTSPFQRSLANPLPKVSDEGSDVSWWDRFRYKNFANDPQAGVKWLQEQNPDLQFSLDEKGEVLAKKPEEQQWKRLDPKGFDLADITDVAWDVPAGIAEGVAAAAGGLAGGVAAAPTVVGAPVGALGGAMAAGGATGATLEAARQGLGKWIGVAPEMSGADIALSGAFGAASPLLFGTGAAAKGIAKGGLKLAGKEASQEAIEASTKELAKAQAGLASRGFGAVKGAVAPRLGEAMSGIDREVLKWAAEPQNMAKIQAAEKDLGSVEIFEGLRSNFMDAAETQKRSVGAQIGAAMKEIPDANIDVSDVQKELRELITNYEARAKNLNTPTAKADLQFLENTLKDYIPEDILSGQGVLNPERAFALKDSLNDISGIRKATPGVDLRPGKLSKVEKDLERVMQSVTSKLDKKALNLMEKGGEKLKDLRQKYKQSIEDAKAVNKLFKDEQTTERTLGSLVKSRSTSQRQQIQGLSDRLGIPVTDAAREAVAIQTLSRPIGMPFSSQGVTSTSRSIPLAAAGGIGGYLVGNEIGGGYGGGLTGGFIGGGLGSMLGGPAAMSQYLRMNAAANRGAQGLMNRSFLGAPVAAPQGALNVWQQMMQNER